MDLSKPPRCRAVHCGFGFGHPELEGLEERFVLGVPKHFKAVVKVLQQDRDDRRRAAAAYVLAYGTSQKAIVRALIPAIKDSNSVVRNNAMRVLVDIQRASDKVIVPAQPLIEALHFPEVTDRNKAVYALAEIVKKNTSTYRTQILRGAGAVLLAMVSMKQPINRDGALLQLLTGLSGSDYGQDVAAWKHWMDGVLSGANGGPRRELGSSGLQPR